MKKLGQRVIRFGISIFSILSSAVLVCQPTYAKTDAVNNDRVATQSENACENNTCSVDARDEIYRENTCSWSVGKRNLESNGCFSPVGYKS